jgi:hypothetical protein
MSFLTIIIQRFSGVGTVVLNKYAVQTAASLMVPERQCAPVYEFLSYFQFIYRCAGVCCYEGRGGLCSVRLSLPLLKLRPRKDLVETLLVSDVYSTWSQKWKCWLSLIMHHVIEVQVNKINTSECISSVAVRIFGLKTWCHVEVFEHGEVECFQTQGFYIWR